MAEQAFRIGKKKEYKEWAGKAPKCPKMTMTGLLGTIVEISRHAIT